MEDFFNTILGIIAFIFIIALQGAIYAIPLGIALWILGVI